MAGWSPEAKKKKKIVVDCTEKRKLAIGWEAISHA
jgi:hypothetical protein